MGGLGDSGAVPGARSFVHVCKIIENQGGGEGICLTKLVIGNEPKEDGTLNGFQLTDRTVKTITEPG